MFLAAIKQFFSLRADRPGGILYALVILGLGLLLLDQLGRVQERKAEHLRWAVQRAALLDSVQRADEAALSELLREMDVTYSKRYEQQAATTKKTRQRDAKLQKRYRANRLALPAY